MIKLKRVLICCIATLCVVMFLLPLFAISMQNVLERQKTNTYPTQNEAALPGYDLANATDKGGGMYKLSNEAYKNTDFVINNLKGLIKFAGLINCNNRDFKNKKIWLASDIDCEGKEIGIGCHLSKYTPWNRGFKGNFHGLNHTIYNYKFGSMTTGKDGDFYKHGNNYYYGLFSYLDGTISNLRVQNGTFIGNSGEVIGGLVGFMTPDAKITECCVENWVVENADNRPWSAKCGIVGGYFTPTTSSNTYVDGAEIASCYVNVEGLDYSVGPYHFKKGVLPFYRGIKIVNCVIKKQGNSGWMNTNLFDPSSAYNANNMQTKGTHGDSSVNSLGGDKSSSIWYYGGDDYNDGFMYLRKFIKWGRLRFTTSAPKIFTNIEIADETEKDYILIPRECVNGKSLPSKEGKTITCFERDVTATPADSNYKGKYIWVFRRLAFEGALTPTYVLKKEANESNRSFRFTSDIDIDISCSECNNKCWSCYDHPERNQTITYLATDATKMTVKVSMFAKKEINIERSGKIIDYVLCFKNVSFIFTERNGCKHNITFSLKTSDDLNVLYLWDNSTDNVENDYLYDIDTSSTKSCVITNTFELGDIVHSAYVTDDILVKLTKRSYNVAIGDKDD